MTNIFFQGFNPVIPIWIWIIILLCSFIVAWWSYAYLETIAVWKKWGLIILRGSVFTILVCLLLNPFFINENVERTTPAINIYYDNSQSLTVERGRYEGISNYREIIDQVRLQIDDRFDVNEYLFDGTVRGGNTPGAEGALTNLQSVMDHMLENQSGMVASVLLSDGIFTQGRNPVFSAQDLSVPIYTVPVGDTTDVQDVVISNIEYNPVSYTNTEQTFRININQDGFAGESIVVQLIKDGNLLETEQIEFPESTSNHLVLFTDLHDEEGFYEYEVNIPGLDGEFTLQNNRESFTVEVLDEKTRIVSLAFEIHPDVASIRRLIATDRQNELISATRLSGGQMMGQNPITLDAPPDLIVLHGLPEPGDPLLSWLQEQNETPVVYFLLPSARERHQQLQNTGFLPYSVRNARSSILDVDLLQAQESYSHPLLEFSPQEFRRFPTVQTYRSDINVSTLSEILFTAEFQRNETGIPLVITRSEGTRRLAGINGFGWNRYERTANETVSGFFRQFFSDVLSWTATSPDYRNLMIDPVKSTFTETEEIEIRATLVNERQEPETDARIEIRLQPAGNTLSGDQNAGQGQSFLMRHTGNGEYRISVGNLPQGNYEVRGLANKADRRIGEDRARFDVSRSMVEFVDTRRNDELLRQLSIRSGGEFLDQYSLDPMFSYLEQNDLDQAIEQTSEETRFFNNHPAWFILALLFLTGEWLIRRTLSLP